MAALIVVKKFHDKKKKNLAMGRDALVRMRKETTTRERSMRILTENLRELKEASEAQLQRAQTSTQPPWQDEEDDGEEEEVIGANAHLYTAIPMEQPEIPFVAEGSTPRHTSTPASPAAPSAPRIEDLLQYASAPSIFPDHGIVYDSLRATPRSPEAAVVASPDEMVSGPRTRVAALPHGSPVSTRGAENQSRVLRHAGRTASAPSHTTPSNRVSMFGSLQRFFRLPSLPVQFTLR